MFCNKIPNVNLVLWPLCLLSMIMMTACSDLDDDLFPTDSDERSAVTAGSIGYRPSQRVADFSILTSTGETFTLSDNLAGGSQAADVLVLYFTMWCPICLTHSDHINNHIIPSFKDRGTVVFGLVDYVSGSVSGSRLAELANGYAGSEFITLADVDNKLQKQLHGSMASVVVIDTNGIVLLNEDYRDGSAVIRVLEQTLP